MTIKIKHKTKLLSIIIAYLFNTSTVLANNQSITLVSELKNIKTTDWQYQALTSLGKRYNCNLKWNNHATNLAITRYKFAVSLNNCLQGIDNITSLQDLIILKKLQHNFASELAKLTNGHGHLTHLRKPQMTCPYPQAPSFQDGERVTTKIAQLETKNTELESEQFSMKTKFNGQVLFFFTDSIGGESNSQTTLGYRTRLVFDTSFFGGDLLRVRLENQNLPRLDDVTDTSLSRLSVDGDTDNATQLSELSYTVPISDRTEIMFGTAGVSLNDVGEVLNPFSSSSSGAVSRYARRDPATLRAPGGAGIGIKQEFNDIVLGFAGYFINNEDVANPQAGRGIFDSSASAIAQLVIEPQDKLAFAVTYTHSYERNDDVNLMGSTGVGDANEPFEQNATTSDNFGVQANWEITSGLEIGGWFGYTQAQQQKDGDDRATILNSALTLAFPDLGKEGNMGGIIIGIPPVISSHDDNDLVTEEIPIHIEALYRIKVNDYIEITPGGFVVFNPDTEDNSTLWVGTVRTEFSF
ncbi:MAG: iron uptake porin [Pleurocapsa sp.]